MNFLRTISFVAVLSVAVFCGVEAVEVSDFVSKKDFEAVKNIIKVDSSHLIFDEESPQFFEFSKYISSFGAEKVEAIWIDQFCPTLGSYLYKFVNLKTLVIMNTGRSGVGPFHVCTGLALISEDVFRLSELETLIICNNETLRTILSPNSGVGGSLKTMFVLENPKLRCDYDRLQQRLGLKEIETGFFVADKTAHSSEFYDADLFIAINPLEEFSSPRKGYSPQSCPAAIGSHSHINSVPCRMSPTEERDWSRRYSV
ncbi:hypothetical protein HOD08_00230 [bacterium]|nr:hypothetical protein [bacterium]